MEQEVLWYRDTGIYGVHRTGSWPTLWEPWRIGVSQVFAGKKGVKSKGDGDQRDKRTGSRCVQGHCPTDGKPERSTRAQSWWGRPQGPKLQGASLLCREGTCSGFYFRNVTLGAEGKMMWVEDEIGGEAWKRGFRKPAVSHRNGETWPKGNMEDHRKNPTKVNSGSAGLCASM